jgi:hypothetical protein
MKNPTEAANRRELRRELLDRIVVLQIQAQCGDAEARSLLEHARDELRRFDGWPHRTGAQPKSHC